METAGSEQTSSVFMLWAKTRVYICSGRAGGNERDLLFYVRHEETCLDPLPPPVDVDCGFSCGWEMWPLSLHCLMMIDVE